MNILPYGIRDRFIDRHKRTVTAVVRLVLVVAAVFVGFVITKSFVHRVGRLDAQKACLEYRFTEIAPSRAGGGQRSVLPSELTRLMGYGQVHLPLQYDHALFLGRLQLPDGTSGLLVCATDLNLIGGSMLPVHFELYRPAGFFVSARSLARFEAAIRLRDDPPEAERMSGTTNSMDLFPGVLSNSGRQLTILVSDRGYDSTICVGLKGVGPGIEFTVSREEESEVRVKPRAKGSGQ